MAAKKQTIPTNLRHKPVIYIDIQNEDYSDAKFISIGHATWQYEDFSIKIFRKPHKRWSRQSEELTPERLLIAALLLISQILDISSGMEEQIISGEEQSVEKLKKRIRDQRNYEIIEKIRTILNK